MARQARAEPSCTSSVTDVAYCILFNSITIDEVWLIFSLERFGVAKRDSPEARVVYSLKQHLVAEGLCGGQVSEVIVDADASYQASSYAKALEPMATVWIDGFRPDLVCSVRRGSYSLVAGFEVKADLADWPKGVTQASAYRNGVHHAFLAVPFATDAKTRSLDQQARDRGIGVLQLDGSEWRETVAPADPRPLPWSLQATSLALAGVPAARKLQLNHPLNYLVVPYLRMLDGDGPLLSLLERHWPDLQQVSSRSYAIEGARVLGLIDMDGGLTPQGATVADLLQGVGFDTASRPAKRLRLADASPPVGAVARSVLLGQPAVSLVVETLRRLPGGSAGIPELLAAAARRDEMLARALFLRDPEHDLNRPLDASDFRSASVFQFKQILWHAGILATKALAGAGQGAANYQPDCDEWQLDERILKHSLKRDN
jgi:hypothetical protein